MRRRVLVLLAVAAAVLAAAPPDASARRGACVAGQDGGPRCQVWTGTVRSVNDGDTMDVHVAGDGTTAVRRIRFMGVQAMELSSYRRTHRLGDCHAVEATARVERLVRRSRGRVRLAALDPWSRSQGRLVRTVAVRSGGRWRDLGSTLMREGRALWWPGSTEWTPNLRYSVLLQQAIAARRGLFDPDGCGIGPSPASPLQLVVNWDARGWQGVDAVGEWVRIRNLDPAAQVSLAGWHLRDAGLRRYTFPAHAVLPPGGSLTVNVGPVGDELSGFPWGRLDNVFNDATHDRRSRGDGAYLFDPLGNVRAAMAYPCRTACADPRQGAIRIGVEPTGRQEWIGLTNVSGAPVDLDGTAVKTDRGSYHLGPGSVIPPGATMTVRTVGDPAEDGALERGWGSDRVLLPDESGIVRLLTYADVPVACGAWGDLTC